MRGALVQRPSICEHPPKSGARARFYSVVDLVNRLDRPPGRQAPGLALANGLRPAARQANRELAKPLRKEIARWGDGRSTRYSPVPGPPSTGQPHRRPTEQLRNRSLPTGAQILPTARTNTSDEKFEKCLLY
jgi:hypothetical protein